MRENWELHWKDYYAILQIHPLAEAEVVRGAYTKLAHKYHPDTNNANKTSDKIKDINEAFEIIGNPEKRGRYYVAYCLKVNPKPIITPPPNRASSKPNYTQTSNTANVPPKTERTHESPPYFNKGWSLHDVPKSNDTEMGGGCAITFILFGVFGILAPWSAYLRYQNGWWLLLSIPLSIILIPCIIIWITAWIKEERTASSKYKMDKKA